MVVDGTVEIHQGGYNCVALNYYHLLLVPLVAFNYSLSPPPSSATPIAAL